MKNKYCNIQDLTNESSVEQFFVIRLLSDLGFKDSEIKTKKAIKELVIGKGSTKENYKPDYAIKINGRIRIILDAKDPNEDIDKYLYQVSGYALSLNQQYDSIKPVKFCILTNGISLKIFRWDTKKPILELSFKNFIDVDKKFKKLKILLKKENLIEKLPITQDEDMFDFDQLSIAKLDSLFRSCHNLIWKKEKIKPTSAFYEFTKLFYVKMEQDKKIHKLNNPQKNDFKFSVHWIESLEDITINPINSILFKDIRDEFERKVKNKEKKRIFNSDEIINLKPSTIKEIVKILQNINLYGIDEDLNGRMFETFLNATIRGKELGQFFTPRTVVEFMVSMSDLKLTKNHTDVVLDGCCGSGGFLIDVMSHMWKKIDANRSLTPKQKNDCKDDVVKKYLWGVDADKDENVRISRIARMNMVLHGDGSNRIYWLPDSLDKKLIIEKGLPDELRDEAEEFKKEIENGLKFDVVLTNPPFSMKYDSSKDDEKAILEDYVLAKMDKTSSKLKSLKSNVMFLERYYDLLKPHGKLLTVIDESVLNTEKGKNVRDFIKTNFIIKCVISLPRNTFVNADTQVKTSILYLIKKENENETQSDIFMAVSQNIGHTDSGRKSSELNDLPAILEKFKEFEDGE